MDSLLAASGASGGSGGAALKCLDQALAVRDMPCGGGWLPQFLQHVNALPLPLTDTDVLRPSDLHGGSWVALLPPQAFQTRNHFNIPGILAPASEPHGTACPACSARSPPQLLSTSLTPFEEPPNLQPLPPRTRGISNRGPASAPPGQPCAPSGSPHNHQANSPHNHWPHEYF